MPGSVCLLADIFCDKYIRACAFAHALFFATSANACGCDCNFHRVLEMVEWRSVSCDCRQLPKQRKDLYCNILRYKVTQSVTFCFSV